ncbi:MAG: phage tail protein [Bacillota bacterium]
MADLIIKKNGQSEMLADFNNLEITEEVNGAFSISFTSFFTANNQFANDLLHEESIVEYEGHEFRVKNYNENMYQKTIKNAPHVFFDLIDDRIYEVNGGTKTVNEFFSFVLSGTGWSFENVDVTGSKLISNFGDGNIISLIWQICEAFSCEIKIEPNRHLKIYKQIGSNNDVQFRYKHNIKVLSKDVDTTRLATVIKGFGGDGLEVTYTSPNVSVFGEIHAEPIKDERFTIPESLIERLRQTLIDYPEVSIEVKEIDVGEEVGLGDKVWLIYEPLGIEFQTRVMARKLYPNVKNENTITFGSQQQGITDLLTETKIEIDENKKQVRSKFEQTNERITLEVEAVNESIASIELENDQITSRVQNVEGGLSTINQRASSIELSVSNLGSRVGSAESSLSIQAGQIATKVEKNGVVSAINQTSETIKLSANRIDLNGITQVNGNLYIGDPGSTGLKSIIMNSGAKISSDWYDPVFGNGIHISANTFSVGDGQVRLGTGGHEVKTEGYLNVAAGHNIVAKFG